MFDRTDFVFVCQLVPVRGRFKFRVGWLYVEGNVTSSRIAEQEGLVYNMAATTRK